MLKASNPQLEILIYVVLTPASLEGHNNKRFFKTVTILTSSKILISPFLTSSSLLHVFHNAYSGEEAEIL